MARYTGPVCRLCRREGVKLYLIPLFRTIITKNFPFRKFQEKCYWINMLCAKSSKNAQVKQLSVICTNTVQSRQLTFCPKVIPLPKPLLCVDLKTCHSLQEYSSVIQEKIRHFIKINNLYKAKKA